VKSDDNGKQREMDGAVVYMDLFRDVLSGLGTDPPLICYFVVLEHGIRIALRWIVHVWVV